MSDDRFKIGDRVRYIPGHAKGDASHPDCEDGIIRAFNRHGHPFVVYDNQVRGVLDTLEKAEKWTAAYTNPEDLVMLEYRVMKEVDKKTNALDAMSAQAYRHVGHDAQMAGGGMTAQETADFLAKASKYWQGVADTLNDAITFRPA